MGILVSLACRISAALLHCGCTRKHDARQSNGGTAHGPAADRHQDSLTRLNEASMGGSSLATCCNIRIVGISRVDDGWGGA